MKIALKKIVSPTYHFVGGKRIDGAPSGVTGILTYVTGDLTGVTGNLSGVMSDMSVQVDLSMVYGNFDDCQITDEERVSGVSIEDLLDRSNGIGYLFRRQSKLRFASRPFPRTFDEKNQVCRNGSESHISGFPLHQHCDSRKTSGFNLLKLAS